MDKLQQLKFKGMFHALEEQLQQTDMSELSFEERLSLLLDREITERENRRLTSRLKKATLKQSACMEDIDFRHPRGLNRSEFLSFASCQWVKAHQNILLVGPSGVGKTYLACALAHKACLEGWTTKYVRLSRLMQQLAIARGDGQYMKLLDQLAKFDVLILDDWGLNPFSAEQRRDLLEILEDRHQLKSTLITSQLPVACWHEYIGDPTLADAILDRLVHNAHKLELIGESLRKKQAEMDKNSLTDKKD
jgi:DNA replication protein DnaC